MNRFKSAIGTLAIIILVFSFVPSIWAQTTGSGLSISPTRTELSLEPGESDVVRISLRNVTSGDIVAQAFINDFVSDNETGQPRIIVDENESNPASIRNFLVGVTDIPLKQGENKTFDIPVQIPEDATPGAYYGVVRYAAVPAGAATPEPGQVSLTASVASIVLIEVAGDIHEQVTFDRLHLYKDDEEANIFLDQPTHVGIEVSNKGNGFARPYGTVTVKDPFGRQVHSAEVNNSDPRNNVLPGSSRIFKEEIKGITWPGLYRVTASIAYGDGGDILVQKRSFWYLPAWFMAVVLVLLLALAVVIYRWRRRPGRTRHARR